MDLSNVIYQHGNIFYKNENGVGFEVEKNSATEPIISPDKSKIIYLSPYGWEIKSSLFLYDLKNNKKRNLISPNDKDYIPKKALWVSENLIVVIIGYAYGTIALGGNVYLYNLEEDSLKPITNYEESIRITEMFLTEGKKLHLKGIRYLDSQFMENESYDTVLKLS